jgi:lipopolysaccharide export system protein LptC
MAPMSSAPMSSARKPAGGPAGGNAQARPSRAGSTAFTGGRLPPTLAAIARRRWLVALGKRLLPVAAVALLAAMALWPELGGEADKARLAYRRDTLTTASGQLTNARYHGLDQHGEPYTVTAASARQVGPDRIDLTTPKADLSMSSGTWVIGQGNAGVFLQKSEQLDLSGEVTLYRDDGTTLTTDAAALDVKAGAAAGAERTHAEGPFGTLDAQGFTLTDHGAVIRFAGPARMVLNGRGQ